MRGERRPVKPRLGGHELVWKVTLLGGALRRIACSLWGHAYVRPWWGFESDLECRRCGDEPRTYAGR